MWKTPEETKKGLECCYSPVEPMMRCEQCPYYGSIVCKMHLHADSLAIIKQLEAQVPRWISVEERLPEEKRRVVVTWHGRVFDAVYLWNGSFETHDGILILAGRDVTHWMPLPEPPET